jgi:RNA polymerase sigma-70 factor (ECF subfamily)
MPAPPEPSVRAEITQIVDHLFRQEAAKMVSALTGVFGLGSLQLAEDVVQEALLQAMQTWSYAGAPENPSAWIMRVAKNRALDAIRRERSFREKEPRIIAFVEQLSDGGGSGAPIFLEHEVRDDQLRMMFACCHPLIPREAQVALTLKTLCGFGEDEIAAAFLTSRDAIAKRLTRARQKIREAGLPFEIPAGPDLPARLDAALQVIYLMFNEGYKASTGDALTRDDLCAEAIRLGSLLAENPAGEQPKTHALLALMLLSGARLASRVDAEGNLLLLADQDRSRWDRAMIARGFAHLNQSAAGEEISEFHLQAGIAYCHCAAETYESTNWARILWLYDALTELKDSPVIALNRVVAVSQIRGPRSALEELAQIRDLERLQSYHYLHAVRAQFHFDLGEWSEAESSLRAALELTTVKAERTFLAKRLQLCAGKLAAIC